MVALLLLLQLTTAAAAVILGIWSKMPWPATAGVGLVCYSAWMEVLPGRRRAQCAWLVIAWVNTIIALAGLLPFGHKPFTLDLYHAIVAWLIVIAILPAGGLLRHSPVIGQARRSAAVSAAALPNAVPPPQRLVPQFASWRILALFWAFLGSLAWLAAAYLENNSPLFHVGIAIALALLLAGKFWFRFPRWGQQIVNTLMLILVGLPLIDLLIRPSYHLGLDREVAKRYYSYEVAKRNPAAFARWWNYYLDQWDLMAHEVFSPDPAHVAPVHLRPNGEGKLFQSRIRINSQGFRGPEIAAQKGNRYRIVCLGESTTFGCTLFPEDKPWPEVLQQMITERLKPSRPVEVINAGVPACDLEHNLYRFAHDLLPLQPDLLISYHGFNGFHLLSEALPRTYSQRPPRYEPRPLKLLADCEYRLKLFPYRLKHMPRPSSVPLAFSDLNATPCAKAYRALAEIARTNHVRFVLANFSMAVNERSSTDVIEFYRAGFPSVYWQLQANAAHSRLVRALAQETPEISLVDTHPGLDGDHGKFIDLIHLAQSGRNQLADTIFAAIKPILEREL